MLPDDHRDPLERLSEEFLRRQRRGDAVDLESFAREHPEHADQIRTLFPMLLQLEGAREPEPARPEERLGRWRILEELGRGGMGIVYLAEDPASGERVALKLMTADHAGAVERFRREAKAVARLEHPQICRVVDTGSEGERLWIAFEYLEGETVADQLRRARRRQDEASPDDEPEARDPARWFAIGEQVARALHVTHEAGLVHRDIKPANILLAKDGRAVVLDFGLAHDDPTGERTRLTHTGVPVGTPAYMSPEQVHARPAPLNGRTDVYSLGATLYEALTLRPPFEGPTVASLFSQILTTDPAPARSLNSRLSRDQELVLATALEKRPERRYRTALDFADDLERARQGRRVRARAPGPVRRLFTWAVRNPLPAGVGASVILALTTGLIVAFSMLSAVRDARDDEAATARVARSRALASASAEARSSDASLSLLLARAAIRARRPPPTITQLHAAVHGSLERSRLTGHDGPLTALAWSADGTKLATGCDDGRARLFAVDGTLLGMVPPKAEPAVPGHLEVALAPSAGCLATLHADRSARLWSAHGSLLARLDESTGPALAIRFLGDNTLATVGGDGRVALHDARGAVLRAWRIQPDAVLNTRVVSQVATSRSPPALHVMLRSGLTVSYDDQGTEVSRRLEAIDAGGAILFDEGRMAFTPKAPQGPGGAAVSPEIRILGANAKVMDSLPGKLHPRSWFCGADTWWCMWSHEGRATILDRSSGKPRTYALDLQASERAGILSASPDGNGLCTIRSMEPRRGLANSSTDPIRLWTPRAALLGALSASEAVVAEALFAPDGSHVALGWHSGGLATVHASAPRELATGVPRWRGEGFVYTPKITADGAHFVFVHDERQLRVVHESGSERTRVVLPSDVRHLDVEPGQGLMLVTVATGGARIYALDGALRLEVPASPKISRAAWLGNDGCFITQIEGPKVRFHAADGRVLSTVTGHPLRPNPTGAFQGEIAIASPDTVRVFDARAEVLRVFAVEKDERPIRYYGSAVLRSILVLRKGRVQSIYRCLDEDGVELWHATAAALGAPMAPISPDGERILIPMRGGLSLRGSDGAEIAHVPVPAWLASTAFGGPGLVTSAYDGSVRIWDLSGKWLYDLPAQASRCIAAFSADGRRLVTVTNAMVRLFTTDVDELEALAKRRSTRAFTEAERARYAEILDPRR